jgi:hypothetical protein
MTDGPCYDCGLPNPRIKARIKFAAENPFMRDGSKVLPFCNDECALQTMFLQPPVRSTRDTIARIRHGRAIRYSEFRSKVISREPISRPSGHGRRRCQLILRPRPGGESHYRIVLDPAQGELGDAPVQREAIELRLSRIR